MRTLQNIHHNLTGRILNLPLQCTHPALLSEQHRQVSSHRGRKHQVFRQADVLSLTLWF